MGVTSIIVTFNRKKDLLRCIKANLLQSKKPDNLLIVNNASTDGTVEEICHFFTFDFSCVESEKLLFLAEKDDVKIYLLNKEKNTGGSGGFYSGLKTAFQELRTDSYWLMDDDGYPSEKCLEQLLKKSSEYDYIMPTSINIENHFELSWAVRKKNGKKTFLYEELKSSYGEIMPYVTPFNGILLSKNCVEKVGYVNPDFFLWGDEYDHYWRCKAAGFEPVTLMNAKFYHPAQKLPLVKICFGLYSVPYVDSPLRMICLARNYTYIYRHYKQKYKIPIKWCMYWWLFIITRRGDFSGWKLYKESVRDGFREDFTRHLQYLNV